MILSIPAVLIVHLVLSQVAVHVVLNLKMIKWHHDKKKHFFRIVRYIPWPILFKGKRHNEVNPK